MREMKLSEAARSLFCTEIAEQESLSQMFAREILKEPTKNTASSFSDIQPVQIKEEKPSYNPKHRLTLRSWDYNVGAVKVPEAKVNSSDAKRNSHGPRIDCLEKSDDRNFEMFKSINQEFKRLREETWQAKLIHCVYSNRALTAFYLVMIFGIIVGVILLKK